MFRLNFTSHVMGPAAAECLKKRGVVQTLRSPRSDIVDELLYGRVKIGETIEVALDGELVGFATIVWVDRIAGDRLSLKDAEHGGFQTVTQLEDALKRAGYRFRNIERYSFYRVSFVWQE